MTERDALTPEGWARLSRILDEALELPPENVPAFLDRACAGDDALRRRAERLIAADRGAGNFLKDPSLVLAAHFQDDPGAGARGATPGPLEAGAVLGSFRIVRELGRGGMGVVYLAERADGAFEQTVAVKVATTGPVSGDFMSRFLEERRILAGLQHPNIARLLDGGVTEGGLPYFVMEYVDGVSIREHCAGAGGKAGPDLRRTLKLFAQVCRAVAYAHLNVVVHRDLKPANILVTATGEVKLLDFGIARVLGPGASGDPEEARVMTPHYAAPEQVRGDSPTTATDVYSLGVILYELLTGRRPHGDTRTASDVLRRSVLADVPEPPSRVAARSSGRPVPRDLDAIVLKALDKDVENRYPAADSLLEDIHRYLDGRPVTARPATLRYVAGKFARRNRLFVGAAALVLVSLVAGLIGTEWQARAAARERDRARLEAEKATRIKDFALGLFQYSDPYRSHGTGITAREMLRAGADWADAELAQDPAVRVEIRNIIGNIYKNLGDFAAADSLMLRALDLSRAAFGPEHDLVAASLAGIGSLAMEAGDYERALAYGDSALAMRRRLHGEQDPGVTESLNELALTHGRLGDYAAADSLLRAALAIDTELYGTDTPEAAVDYHNLGMLRSQAGRDAEAMDMLRRALAIRERNPGHETIVTATTLGGLALAHEHLGELDAADSLFSEELRIRQRLLDPEHPDISLSLENLGNVALARGEYRRAADLMNRAVAIRERHQSVETPDMSRLYNNLAMINYRMGDLATAAERFGQALAGLRKNLGEDSPGTLACANNLAVTLRTLGRYGEAEPMLRDILTRRERILGPGNAQTGVSLYHLGLLCRATGRGAEAESLIRSALDIQRDSGSPVRVIECLTALGDVCRDRHGLEESLDAFTRARAACDTVYSEPGPATATVLVGLGRTLCALHRPGEAEPLLRQALDLRHAAFDDADPRVAEAEVALGCCLDRNRGEEARGLLRHGVAGLEAAPPSTDPLLAEGRAALRKLD